MSSKASERLPTDANVLAAASQSRGRSAGGPACADRRLPPPRRRRDNSPGSGPAGSCPFALILVLICGLFIRIKACADAPLDLLGLGGWIVGEFLLELVLQAAAAKPRPKPRPLARRAELA